MSIGTTLCFEFKWNWTTPSTQGDWELWPPPKCPDCLCLSLIPAESPPRSHLSSLFSWQWCPFTWFCATAKHVGIADLSGTLGRGAEAASHSKQFEVCRRWWRPWEYLTAESVPWPQVLCVCPSWPPGPYQCPSALGDTEATHFYYGQRSCLAIFKLVLLRFTHPLSL